MVVKLAEFFRIDENDLLLSWLSDKLVYEIEGEDIAMKALQLAEAKVEYLTLGKINRNEILRKLKNALKEFRQIQKAWIYGSFFREDDKSTSDIDIALETDPEFILRSRGAAACFGNNQKKEGGYRFHRFI